MFFSAENLMKQRLEGQIYKAQRSGYLVSAGKTQVKYQVTYRLTHPQSLPATSSAVVDAHTHRELEARLAKIKTKWQAQGYTVQILRVMAEQPSPSYKKHHFVRAEI